MSQSNEEGRNEKVNVSDNSFSIILRNPETKEVINVIHDEAKAKDELERKVSTRSRISSIWLQP